MLGTVPGIRLCYLLGRCSPGAASAVSTLSPYSCGRPPSRNRSTSVQTQISDSVPSTEVRLLTPLTRAILQDNP